MRKISCKWIFIVVERVVDNYEDMPRLNDWVANEGRRSIGSIDSDSGNVQHGNRLGRTTHLILDIWWEGDGVPEGIGTLLISSRCLPSLFLV